MGTITARARFCPCSPKNRARWTWLFAYLDARAWAAYSIRALALILLAMLATASLVKRWRRWLWTEWAAYLSAVIIAGCWIYDEFVARPALDRTVRVALLGSWLIVIALVAGVLIWAWPAVKRRNQPANATCDPTRARVPG